MHLWLSTILNMVSSVLQGHMSVPSSAEISKTFPCLLLACLHRLLTWARRRPSLLSTGRQVGHCLSSSACLAEVGSDLDPPTFCCCRTDPGLEQLTVLMWAPLLWLPAECSSSEQRWLSQCLCAWILRGPYFHHPMGISVFTSFDQEINNTVSSLCNSEINIYLKSPQLSVLLSSLNCRTFYSFMPIQSKANYVV